MPQDWDRGTPRDATPPPPPGIRVRTTAVRGNARGTESSPTSPLEGDGFEPSVPRQESRRFEPASVPSRVGRCRRGGYGPGGDRRPDRAVEIADRRWCASEPPLESRIKLSRRVGPSRGTDGSKSISLRCNKGFYVAFTICYVLATHANPQAHPQRFCRCRWTCVEDLGRSPLPDACFAQRSSMTSQISNIRRQVRLSS